MHVIDKKNSSHVLIIKSNASNKNKKLSGNSDFPNGIMKKTPPTQNCFVHWKSCFLLITCGVYLCTFTTPSCGPTTWERVRVAHSIGHPPCCLRAQTSTKMMDSSGASTKKSNFETSKNNWLFHWMRNMLNVNGYLRVFFRWMSIQWLRPYTWCLWLRSGCVAFHSMTSHAWCTCHGRNRWIDKSWDTKRITSAPKCKINDNFRLKKDYLMISKICLKWK